MLSRLFRLFDRKRPARRPRAVRRVWRPMCEQLEQRELLAGFTAGDLAVTLVGDGTHTLTTGNIGTSAQTTIQGVNPTTGVVDTTVNLPTSGSGVFSLGTSNFEGLLSKSVDTQYISLIGYKAAPQTANIQATASGSSGFNRVVARIDSAGNIDTSTQLPNDYNYLDPDGAISNDGQEFWTWGFGTSSSTGLRYIPFGNTTGSATEIQEDVFSPHTLGIYGGNLYLTNTFTSTGLTNIDQVGTGLPSANIGGPITPLSNLTNAGESPFGFQFYHLSGGNAQDPNTVFIADDNAIASGGGLQEWTFDGTNWNLITTFTTGLTTGLRGLTGTVDGSGNPLLYATTDISGSGGNQIVSIDVTGMSASFTTVATAPANKEYLGISFAPTFTGATVTTVTSSQSPQGVGLSVTFTAKVVGNGSPTGSVNFSVDGGAPTNEPLVSGVATFPTSSLTVGSHSIVASYVPTAPFLASTSAPFTEVITSTAPTSITSLTADANPIQVGGSVHFSATMTPSDNLFDTAGSVQFFSDGTLIDTESISGTGPQTATTPAISGATLGLGPHFITAKYLGNTHYTASTSSALGETVDRAFGAGDIVVEQIGGLAATDTNGSAAPVFLKEFNTGGTLQQSILLPTAVLGPNQPFTQDGSNQNYAIGDLNDSANGRYLTLGGVAAPLGTADITGKSAGLFQRVAARIDPTGAIDTSTTFGPTGFDGQAIHNVVTDDGNRYWAVGTGTQNNQGFNYANEGATTATNIVSSDARGSQVFGPRNIGIVNGQLVIDSAFFQDFISQVGNNLPNTATTTMQPIPGIPEFSPANYNGFVFLNRNGGTTPDTLYIAEQTTGVLKFSFNGTTWTYEGQTFGTGAFLGATGITAKVNGSNADLYVTLGSGSTSGTGLFKFTDTAASNALITGSWTQLALAPANTVWRGVALAPTAAGATSTTTTLAVSPTTTPVFGQTLTLTATVTGGTPSGRVSFRDGSVTLGTVSVSGGTAILNISTLALGSHSLSAVYLGDSATASSTSSATGVTVGQASTTTTVVSSSDHSVSGTVTLTATVVPVSPSSGFPTGTVTFKDGSTTLGTGTLAVNGIKDVATFVTSGLAAGAHSITAVYGGDTNFATSTSATLTETIVTTASSTAVTSSLNPSYFVQPGIPVTFSVSVTGTGGTPSGSVTVFDNGVNLGNLPLSGGAVNFVFPSTSPISLPNLSAGTHPLTFVYSGDSTFANSSTTVSEVVKAAFTTGDVVVEQVGTPNSLAPASRTAAPVFFSEFNPSTTNQTSPLLNLELPTAASGGNFALTTSISDNFQGFVSQSANGSYLTTVGYNAAPGTANVDGTSTTGTGAVVRVVGRVDGNDNIDTTTSTTDFSARSVDGAISNDGAEFWLTGGGNTANPGLRYIGSLGGSGAAIGIQTGATGNIITSPRDPAIVDNTLYASNGFFPNNVTFFGTAGTLPTAAGATATTLPGLSATGPSIVQALGLAMLDVGSTGSANLLYLADQEQGIEKYSFSGGLWNFDGAVAGSYTGIAAQVDPNNSANVDIFATTLGSSTTADTLVKFVDDAGRTNPIHGTLTTLASAAVDPTRFRGVSLAHHIRPTKIGLTSTNQALGSTVFTATVSPADGGGGTPTGTIDYIDTTANTTSGFVALGSTFTAPGNDVIAVIYQPDAPSNLVFGISTTMPPAIRSVTLNTNNAAGNGVTGAPRYSDVTSISYTFDRPVTLGAGAFAAGAWAFPLFTKNGIANSTLGAIPGTITLTSSAGGTVWTLTFSGANTNGGSLVNGVYALTPIVTAVTDGFGQNAVSFRTDTFYRLYGDSNADKRVNNTDLIKFNSTFGLLQGQAGYLSYFDFNGDHRVNNTDLIQFNNNFGSVWSAFTTTI